MTTGTSAAAASSLTTSWEPERIAIASTYRDSTRAVSAIDSPRESCSSSPRSTIGVAPSSATPTSNEIRVRVEGFSDERDAAARQLTGTGAVPPSRFQLKSPVEQLAQSKCPELFACEEIALQGEDTKRVEIRAIGWNLFHGRDFPPDPTLFTWRSRLLRITESNATHAQVNRNLLPEFATLLAETGWDVALLQECPPRFAAPLARACGADAHRVLTSRNSLGALRALAGRLNPDLIASGEGGSNLTLVRPSGILGGIVARGELAIHVGRPERRAMALTRTRSGLCVANLHGQTTGPSWPSRTCCRRQLPL